MSAHSLWRSESHSSWRTYVKFVFSIRSTQASDEFQDGFNDARIAVGVPIRQGNFSSHVSGVGRPVFYSFGVLSYIVWNIIVNIAKGNCSDNLS